MLSRKQEAQNSDTFLLENSLILTKMGKRIFEVTKDLLCNYILLGNITEFQKGPNCVDYLVRDMSLDRR